MQEGLLPFAAEVFGEQRTWVFQQDNAPIHTSSQSRYWLSEKSIRTLPWPARSLDLNIIEKVWGLLARRVYLRGRQFDSLDELEQEVRSAWAAIEPSYLLKLYNSMKRRMMAIMDAKGGETSY